MAELLPTAYYHVVFTVPNQLRGLIFQNQHFLYDALFKTSSPNSVWVGDITYLWTAEHTFGRLSIEADLNLYKIKEIMGHENIKTTERYISVSTGSIKRSFSQVVIL